MMGKGARLGNPGDRSYYSHEPGEAVLNPWADAFA